MEEQPTTLEVNVHETVNAQDVPPGTPASLTPDEERVNKEKIITETIRLQGRYVEPHKLKSRWATGADIPTIIADGKDMLMLCKLPRGLAMSAKAIAHSQINNTDPIRFFVMPSRDGNGLLVINPVIINHTKVPVFKDTEGCMSFPNEPMKSMVPRFSKITVRYQTLGTKGQNPDPVLTLVAEEELVGEASHIFQHECGHFNGVYLYDEDYTPEASAGFGDGKPVDLTIWDPKDVPAN
jgi:peptide deformylase